ncbi:glutamate synthase, putative (macronuclear) [Tetrahymena thermophila SB210]|uniref:glutamate synthase (ferredoxin) n=1 Tax=Tetrahymena thermophila (strain SB210) TaxID=312017 RepID=Q24DC7_TETTS|nr:glutamate synthase, putative [Tetrahymena thermophila SB210]EAS05778.1 glutamate synthase, putative [Tetrahymena thermophila SB210]|eukprot:XP_001026023.1 glutamate synthase, putative [Tetrahymena thermophila SB210]
MIKNLSKGNSGIQQILKSHSSLQVKKYFSTSWKWEHLNLWEKPLSLKERAQESSSLKQELEQKQVQANNSQEELQLSEPLRTSHQITLKQQIPINSIKEYFNSLVVKEKGTTSFDDYLKHRAQLKLLNQANNQPQQQHQVQQPLQQQTITKSSFSTQTAQAYEELKLLAKKRGMTVSQFVALSNQMIRTLNCKSTFEERKSNYSDDLKKEFEEYTTEQIAQILSCHIEIGGMSDGALSSQVHRHLTHAANKTGVLSNAGEGGVEEDRHQTIENPLIIQCASGRFGFDLTSIIEADEVQIKLAQGAKPGEGGHLPGSKVSLRIAAIRRARKGTTLISPQPQHDLYSIEDLYLLIHALKSVKPGIQVNVKLASDPDVAITALGAVKAGADRITIAGHSGGTGAAKISSIFNTGMPWEWGVALTHQMLDAYDLRNKIQLVASGGIVNGCDVVEAILLGADKVEIGTSALVSLGCIMLRKCHSPRSISIDSLIQPLKKSAESKNIDVNLLARMVYDSLCEAGYVEVSTGAVTLDYQEMEERHGNLNELGLEESLVEISRKVLENASGGCTVGLNTQDPLYIKKYEGTPEKAQDFLFMMGLGALRYMNEKCNQKGSLYKLRGRAKEFLQSNRFFSDMDMLLGKIQLKAQKGYIDTLLQIPSEKDIKVIERIQSHIQEHKNSSEIPPLLINDISLTQSDVSFGAAISGYCQYHNVNFPIKIHLHSSHQVGPQNFGCFLKNNITLVIEGSCNDHVGKANSGGKIVVKKKQNNLKVIVGNSIGFGATCGEMYIDGCSGTRSFVRNSGMEAVVTGNVNDHFCEFMTRGNVVVLGKVGRNCGAGMTGGYLFLNYDIEQNRKNVTGKRFLSLEEHSDARDIFKRLVENCYKETQSKEAKHVLDNWQESVKKFKFHNPYNLNFLLESDYLNKSKKENTYELFASDSGVGESLAKLFNSKKRQTPFSFRFNGVAGNDFASFCPPQCNMIFEGSRLGQFVGYASKGNVVLNQKSAGKLSGAFTGRYPFMRSSANIFVKSENELGHHALFQFNGTAIITNTGVNCCHELRENAKVIVLGEIGHGFAKNAHLQSTIIVNVNKAANVNEDSLKQLTFQQSKWILEYFRQFSKLIPHNSPQGTTSKKSQQHNSQEKEIIFQNGDLVIYNDTNNQFTELENIKMIEKHFRMFNHEKDFYSYKNIKEREKIIKLAKNLLKIQQSAGWNSEIQTCIESIAKSGLDEMTYSMGDQLNFQDRFMNSGSSTNFYGLFRQPFAQETRPPVDADSESQFINTDIYIKAYSPNEYKETYYKFDHPIISSSQLEQLLHQVNPIEVDLRCDVFEIQVAETTVEEKIDMILKQIRNEIVVGNKRVILFTHRLGSESESRTSDHIETQRDDSFNDQMHLDSWVIIGLIRQRLKKEGLVDFDVILETDEPIDPHSLDVLLNVCGVKLVYPRAVEKHFSVLANRYKDLRGATYTSQELWRNYAIGMQKALKRIIAKDGDVDLSTRVYAQTYTCLFLQKKLANQIGVESFFSAEALNLGFIASVFQNRFMGTINDGILNSSNLQSNTKIEQDLNKGNMLKSSKKFQHLWDNKRVDALQTMIAKPSLDSFFAYFEKLTRVNIRQNFKDRPHTVSVAVIGAGPAGLETAIQISNNYPEVDEIVLFDSYFAPGGKIIDAVAPDHPITKKQLKNFSIFEHEKIKFVGNSYIDQRRMRYIYEQFSAVFLTHGATPRKLAENISGKEYVISADDVVKWYNSKTDMNDNNTEGIPFYRTEKAHPPCPFSIPETESISIIGVGNVSLDIARILLRNPDDAILKDNITTYVYNELKRSRVRNVTCIGRREPYEAKFGMPELLELKDLADNEKQFQLAAQFDLLTASANVEKIKQKLIKKQQSLAQLQSQPKQKEQQDQADQLKEEVEELENRIQLFEFFKQYHKTPEQINEMKQNSTIKFINFIFNEDIDPVKGFEKQSGTNRVMGHFISGNTIEAEAFIASLGYQPHMPVSNILQITPSGQTGFSTQKQAQQSQAGTIAQTPTYIVPNLLVAGQAKTGIGTIGHTKSDVKTLLKNFNAENLQKKPSVEGFLEDYYYKQGAVSKDIVLQIMQSLRSHYTQKYITPSVIKKHIENYRKLLFMQQQADKGATITKQSDIQNKNVQQSDTSKQPRKLKILQDLNDSNPKEIELPISDKSLRDCLNIMQGDCESGSCGGCFVFTQDPVEQYEQAEQKIAISKGGLSAESIPKECKAILSCQHTAKDLMSDRITKLILSGSNRSACGIGVHKTKQSSIEFVQSAVRHLKDDLARGAGVSGYGDGAGLLLKIDWDFFESYGGFSQSILENFDEIKKSLAICQVFIRDNNDIKLIEDKLTRQGLAVIHKREVIINQKKFILGEARQHPLSYQFFVVPQQPNTLDKIIQKIQQNPRSVVTETDALASISTKYVCYKLASFASEIEAYEDLNPKYGYKADTILTHTRFATTTLQPKLTGNVATAAIKAHPFQNLIHNGEIVTKRSIISYLEKNSELFKEKGILIDREELIKCSDSYVLQRYIQCLKSLYPELSLEDIIHMITRSTRGDSQLSEYARAKGMPQVCGPCNLSMYDEYNDTLVFFRDNSGFRPAILVTQEDQIHIVSQQQCQSLNDKVSLLEEGQIYVINNQNVFREYTPNDTKVPKNFQIKTLPS